jgi:hypothetical protein
MTLVQQINQAHAPVHIEVQERPVGAAAGGPDVTAELVRSGADSWPRQGAPVAWLRKALCAAACFWPPRSWARLCMQLLVAWPPSYCIPCNSVFPPGLLAA